MGKKFVISVVAIIALVAIWRTDAEAQSCLSWRTIGGSSMCVAWAPKGVEAEVKFNQACVVAGDEGPTCNAFANVVATDSIAFCVDPSAPGGIRAVQCPGAREFTTVAQTTCNERDNESATG